MKEIKCNTSNDKACMIDSRSDERLKTKVNENDYEFHLFYYFISFI